MVKSSGPHRLGTLALFVLACEAVGFIGSIFTLQSIPSWYAALIKPPFNPPDWLFAPVWAILYALMGIAAFFIWEHANGAGKRDGRACAALNMFGVQLILNALWSAVFFGMHSPLLGFIVILLLLFAIVLATWRFYSIDLRAFWLMTPYLLWVCFAALLNFYIFALNP